MKTFSQVVLSRIVAFATIAYVGGRKLNDTIYLLIPRVLNLFLLNWSWLATCATSIEGSRHNGPSVANSNCDSRSNLVSCVQWGDSLVIALMSHKSVWEWKKNGTGSWVSWYKIEKCYLIKLYSSFSCSVLTTLKKTNDNSKSIDT